jgi:glycine oxidase
MKQFDFVILGFGVAGAAITRELAQRGARILVIDSGEKTATAIAGGTIHPAVLRYYNKVWRADEFWPRAKSFYQSWERELQVSLIKSKGLVRIFDSADEPNQWKEKRKDAFWQQYLRPLTKEQAEDLSQINAPYGYGSIEDFWRFDPAFLLSTYRNKLKETEQYITARLSFDSQEVLFRQIASLGVKTERIVLAQGHQQDFWPGLIHGSPIQAKQGQYVIIECPGLKLTRVLKSKFFIIPLGGDRYQVGATYPRDCDQNAIEEAQKGILADLELLLKLPYRIIDHWTGIRPGTKDRRPILGALNSKKNIYVFNGLNSRGLLMAPLLAHWLADFMLEGKALPSEVSVNRFF